MIKPEYQQIVVEDSTDRQFGDDDFSEERLDDHSEVWASVILAWLHKLVQ